MTTNEPQEPDYLTWSPSKREPDPAPPPVDTTPPATVEDPLESSGATAPDSLQRTEPEPALRAPEPEAEPELDEARIADAEMVLESDPEALLVTEALDPQEPEEEVAEWMHPDPIAAVAVVDEPVVERTEPEEISVPESADVEEVIDAADDEEDEIVFDLGSLSTEERRHLSMRLTGAGIAHIWEVATDLVVSVKDAPLIESYLDEVRNPQGFADEELVEFESDEDVDDEAVYAAMSDLYVAADKLMQRAGDPSARTAFYNAVDDVDGLPAPFGFDPRVWSQVQELANSIADAMDGNADDDTVGGDARTLRQLLVNYV